MAELETVILDLGNVLMFHDNARLWRNLGARAGLPAEVVVERIDAELLGRATRGELSRAELQREVCARLGVDWSAELFAELWCSHFSPNAPMLPLVEALLGRVRLVLLSNTNALHADYFLPRLPLLQRFDALLLSHEIGCAKPEPAAFRCALARAGSAPEASAFFDDLPEFVAAAHALGIRAQLFSDAREFPDQLRRLGVELPAAALAAAAAS